MTRIAHFDPANGVSGDMAISALVHAGRALGVEIGAQVAEAIESLGLGCSVSFVDDERGGLACLRTEIKTDGSRYLPRDLRAAIERSSLEGPAKEGALAALRAIVEAESAVHGIDAESVHLHELGSADTAADLVGAAQAIDALGVTSSTAASVPVPHGWIGSEHGALPLPAPVTLELLRGRSIHGVGATTELVTPTGAALLHAFTRDAAAPSMRLLGVGVGGGKRITERPNVCRVFIGEASDASTGRCVLLETNIDDQTPEAIGHVLDQLIAHGALDAWVTHITMKRSRPAFALSALVSPEDEARLTELVFRETTTLGVRRRDTTRRVLAREIVNVDVDGSAVRVKIGRLGDEVVNLAPEFADCVAAAERSGLAVKTVYARAQELARGSL
jgi:uncharacterized protein (TIGR00299 family) protein